MLAGRASQGVAVAIPPKLAYELPGALCQDVVWTHAVVARMIRA
jgi:hypothetical protein